MPATPDTMETRYNGLTMLTEGLPADAYFDASRYER